MKPIPLQFFFTWSVISNYPLIYGSTLILGGKKSPKKPKYICEFWWLPQALCEAVLENLGTSPEQAIEKVLNKLITRNEKVLYKSWTCQEHVEYTFWKRSWQNYEKALEKLWKSSEQVLTNIWASFEQVVEIVWQLIKTSNKLWISQK